MIAEALDAGVVSVAAVGTIVLLALGIGMAYAGIKAAIGRLDEKVDGLSEALVGHEKAAQKHRHDDNVRFEDHGHRLGRIEFWHERNGDFTPVRDTDRFRTVRSTADTGPGDSR